MKESMIKLYGNPVLRKKCKEFDEFGLNRNIEKLISIMAEVMYTNKGIGLAASQLGVLKRVITVDIGEGLISLVNPEVLWRQGKQVMTEGCLSIPGINLDIKRSQEVIVEGLNNKGKKVQIGAMNIFARVLQHEIDHLDGILMIDSVPKRSLKPIKGKLEEIKRKE